jgi:hypothetical protein
MSRLLMFKSLATSLAADEPSASCLGAAPANPQMEQTVGLARKRADLPQLSPQPRWLAVVP